MKKLLQLLLGTPAQSPRPGTFVNHAKSGLVLRSDGVVVGPQGNGVLVEWKTGGHSTLPAGELEPIAA